MTHQTLETVDKVRDEKDDRLLLPSIRGQNRLTEWNKNPHKDQAINRTTRRTRVQFHADSSSVKIRHVSSGIFPCVRIICMKKDVYMATHAISDMLPEGTSSQKSNNVGAKDQLLC